jgi:hypothetical protein
MPNRPDRPDSPNGASVGGKPSTIVFEFPGLSIMQHQWLSARMVVVTCPSCGASHLYSTATPPTTFVHEDDACPILRRIEAALAIFQAWQTCADTN